MADESGSVELGAAYLSLLISTRDLKPSLKSAMSEIGATSGKVGKTWQDKVGGGMKKALKWGAIGVGGLATTVAALAAKGGISRALNIEDAQAKLKGLGHDTKSVDTIMSNALASVKGTAFGLGDAATVAAQTVAAGIKPGKELTRVLTLVGDAATIGGTSFGEMGSIFAKAAASNKVQGDILNQVTERGIPIVQLLAKELGKTSAEVYEMSEKGQIDFATFSKAMEKGLGGAAQSSGKTFRGAWANVMAAISRGGEVVVKPVLDLLRDGFNNAIPVIDKMVGALKPFISDIAKRLPGIISEITGGFEAFRAAFEYADGDITSSGFPGFMERLGYATAVTWDIIKNKIVPALQDLGDWVVRNKDWLGALTVAVATGTIIWKLYNLAMGGYTAVAKLVTDLIKGQTNAQLLLNKAWKAHPVGLIISAVAALVVGFIYLWKTNEGFRNFFINAWNAIKKVVGVVGGFIGKIFSAIAGWVTGTLIPIFQQLWTGVIKPVWGAIAKAIEAAGAIIRGVFLAVSGFISKTLGPVFRWLLDKIIRPVWKVISFIVDAAANVLLLIFDLIVFTVRKIIGPAFVWLYQNVIKPMWGLIGSFIRATWGIVKAIFRAIVTYVKDTLGARFTWLYEKIIKPVWGFIKWYISNTWAGMKIVFNAIRDFLVDKLGPIFRWLRDKVVKPVWDGIKSTVSTVWNKGIKPIFQALSDFVRDKVAPAFGKAVDIIKSFWDKLKAIALAPINFIIGTVYNRGIVGTFNKVAEAIGSKARLKTLGLLGQPKSNSSQGRGYGNTKVQARARGGFTPRGWTLVGEEGPELVNFASPGMVYTAAQTKLMQAGREQAPDGAIAQFDKNGKGMVPQGGWLSSLAGSVGGALTSAWKKSTQWVRGGLAKAAEFILSPVKTLLNKSLPDSGMSRLAKDLGSNTIDNVVKWIRGNDEVPAGEGGGTGAVYNGAKGAFHRPSHGPITSRFGPRWGGFHAGTDIAGGGKTFAALNGIVKYVGWGGGLPGRTGEGIRLSHGGGFETYYGHNPHGGIQVRVGEKVRGGQHIGYQGATGNVTGVHLHFETLQNGRAINPETYLHDNGGWHAPGTMSLNMLKKPEAILTPGEWDSAERAIALASQGNGRSIDMRNSQFGYDPQEVADRIERKERRAQIMAGIS